MATDVLVTWAFTPTRESDRSLDPLTDLAGAEISISADLGQSFTVVDTFAPDITDNLFPELEDGEWQFRGVAVDIDGKRSDPVFGVIIIDNSNPSALADLTVALA